SDDNTQSTPQALLGNARRCWRGTPLSCQGHNLGGGTPVEDYVSILHCHRLGFFWLGLMDPRPKCPVGAQILRAGSVQLHFLIDEAVTKAISPVGFVRFLA